MHHNSIFLLYVIILWLGLTLVVICLSQPSTFIQQPWLQVQNASGFWNPNFLHKSSSATSIRYGSCSQLKWPWKGAVTAILSPSFFFPFPFHFVCMLLQFLFQQQWLHMWHSSFLCRMQLAVADCMWCILSQARLKANQNGIKIFNVWIFF